jgi:hypothetical protein
LFRKKPVVIEARQYTGRNGVELLGWIGGSELEEEFTGDSIEIRTLEGTMRADKLDWVIKGVKGEFYPCKPDIFKAIYEPVADVDAVARGAEASTD